MPDTKSVERLARQLYEASHGGGTPWFQRGWDVRQAWLSTAREKIDATDAPAGGVGFWHGLKTVFRR